MRPRRPVRWIDRQEEFEELCRSLSSEPVVGFDIETKLDCRTWCTAQFATRSGTAIVDMLAIPRKDPVRWFSENGRVVKVIHNASFERGVLGHHGLRIDRVFDTLLASRNLRGRGAPGGHNLSGVCRRELGFGLDKVHWNSDWVRRPLPAEQYFYAALDAEVLIDLYEIFVREIHARGDTVRYS